MYEEKAHPLIQVKVLTWRAKGKYV